jgi:hypothetical protein
MKATLAFVPPGGGETDYQMDFDLPTVPQKGDYIMIKEPGAEIRFRSFTVRRTIWSLTYPPENRRDALGGVESVLVECEFARNSLMSKAHAQSCDMYERRGKPMTDQEDTAY